MDCFISQEIALFILLVLSGTAYAIASDPLYLFAPQCSVKAPRTGSMWGIDPGAVSPLKEQREGGHR